MTKQIRPFLVLLVFVLVSYWLLSQNSAPTFAPITIIARTLDGLPDSVLLSAGPEYHRSAVSTWFLGKHNRKIWTTPVKAKVLDLDQTWGGLKIVAQGGGMQTLSFTLVDSVGHTYALRSVDKDPISVLSPFWQKTWLGNFVRDQTSGANPYGALMVPVLAQAAGISHATPQLYYVRPHDPLFRPFATQAGGKLFLLEEKHQNNPQFYPGLESASAIVNTETFLKNRLSSSAHQANVKEYMKCRLFDFLVGDWDRHEGQWMWAVYPQGSKTWYVPVPKDRDQAFCNYRDGLLPWLTTRRWAMPKFGQFSDTLDDVYGLMVNAAYLDSVILSNVPVNNFKKIAQQLQQSLPDTTINRAVKQLPAGVYPIVGEEIKKNLKKRRDQLPQAAQQFYQLLKHPNSN
ncbi:hypothetical protein [Adhaeribacter pallidiroseus]|uniref:Uncharacterized protein n=1 Tax=Adhaeribacter pallidiroseus TaxID=2072847 RepID=A0A369QQM7_9BACT|nr:hypothetical protein [Adhaeribacter pallidiroseus]RDC65149.1 hypothetical protein AHMF7616_03779 [Adhaeribacter pallidiroseus]